MFAGQNVLDLCSSRRKIRFGKAWGRLHLLPQSNWVDLKFRVAIRTMFVTFGVSVQLCSETEWTSGDDRMDVFLRRF